MHDHRYYKQKFGRFREARCVSIVVESDGKCIKALCFGKMTLGVLLFLQPALSLVRPPGEKGLLRLLTACALPSKILEMSQTCPYRCRGCPDSFFQFVFVVTTVLNQSTAYRKAKSTSLQYQLFPEVEIPQEAGKISVAMECSENSRSIYRGNEVALSGSWVRLLYISVKQSVWKGT